MISEKIKALFQLIEFLHSNIDNFKRYDDVMAELDLLADERSKLHPQKNFSDKLKYDELQEKIKARMEVIKKNIINPIKSKVTELNVCNLKDSPNFNWNGVETDIRILKEKFDKEDINEILKYKSKYIEFRTKTNCTYFQNVFFGDLDSIAKDLFNYFNESEHDEFEAFEAKDHKTTIEAGNIINVNTKQTEKALASNKASELVLKNLSAIIKLFEIYGSEFPEETLDIWLKRWEANDENVYPIKVEPFGINNNKHLLLTILSEAQPYMKVKSNIADFIKRKWGLKAYYSDVSRHIRRGFEYFDSKKIRSIINNE